MKVSGSRQTYLAIPLDPGSREFQVLRAVLVVLVCPKIKWNQMSKSEVSNLREYTEVECRIFKVTLNGNFGVKKLRVKKALK